MLPLNIACIHTKDRSTILVIQKCNAEKHKEWIQVKLAILYCVAMHMNIKSSHVSIIMNRTLECAYQKCVHIIKMISCMRGILLLILHTYQHTMIISLMKQ